MSDHTSRFLAYFEHLIATQQVSSQDDFAKKIGVRPSTLTEVIKKRTKAISSNILVKTIDRFGTLNANWLFYGIESMLRELPNEPAIVTVDQQGRKNIAYVNTKARAGYLSGYADPEYIGGLPMAYLPQLPREKDYRMFEVSGDSMWPTFNDKDTVICQYLSRSNVKDNQLCVVVSTEGILIKRIFNRIKEEQQLILKSDNQEMNGEYPDILVPAQDVKEIWQVVKRVGDIRSESNSTATLLTELKATLNRLTNQPDSNNP